MQLHEVLLWGGFSALVVVLLFVDLKVVSARSEVMTVKSALLWSAMWISTALLFNLFIFLEEGSDAGVEYLTGYVIEKSLSVDNLFVIALLMRGFKVPAQHQHRILFWGIMGAIVLRGIMIGAGVWLVAHFDWIFYVFGAYLAFTGIKLLFVEESTEDAEDTFFIRWAKRLLPVSKADPNGKFIIREDGKIRLTSLALVLVAVEGTDVVFALDSVPAVLGVTTDGFLVFSSNLFAILGLRALYFVLAGVLQKFHYLSIALALILVFIGAKMILHSFVKVPNLASLGVIVALVTGGVLASMWSGRTRSAQPKPDA